MSPPPLFSPHDDWGDEDDTPSINWDARPPHVTSIPSVLRTVNSLGEEADGFSGANTSGGRSAEAEASIPAYPPFVGLPDIPALATLKTRRQFVAWKYVPKPGKPKPDKVPINPATGRAASTSDPTTWGTYEAAAACARRMKLPGVGYVLTADDGLCGIDLDDCRDAETGELQPWANEIVSLGETYFEASPSGEGARGFSLGSPLARLHGNRPASRSTDRVAT